MGFLNKFSLFFIVLIFGSFLFFANVFSFTNIDTPILLQKNFLYQNIYSPFNVSIIEDQVPLKSSSPSDYQSNIQSAYSKFNPYSQSTFLNSFFCNVGGSYIINVTSYPSNGGILGGDSVLFNCKTTQDLINMIKIPSSWQNDNLILYCNDGKKINSITNNFDFLTTGLNTYKSCILKNLNKGATIIYGLDSGNLNLDSNPVNFFNSTTHKGSIINSNFVYNTTSGGKFVFKDKKDLRNYYFSYNSATKFYSLSDLDLSLTTPISTIFTKNIGISRIALFKSFGAGHNIYGYETAISIEIGNTTVIKPIYKINYGVNVLPSLSSLKCVKYFGKYDSKSLVSAKISISDKIVCGNSEILINSQAIDGSNYGKKHGSVNSFNIFKNIILGLN